MTQKVVIVLGAGGHARVVADALIASGARVIGFTDPRSELHGNILCGLPVLGDDNIIESKCYSNALLANGMGGVDAHGLKIRKQIQTEFEERGWRFCSVIHPTASVSPFASLGECVQLMAGSVINPGVVVGDGVIINTSAVIEHDAQIESWTHVAPRAVVCGQVKIGAESHIGAGAVIRQGVILGRCAQVGVGAVVTKDYLGTSFIVGVPAKPIIK